MNTDGQKLSVITDGARHPRLLIVCPSKLLRHPSIIRASAKFALQFGEMVIFNTTHRGSLPLGKLNK